MSKMYDPDKVIRSLSRKKDLKIDLREKIIYRLVQGLDNKGRVIEPNNDVGIKSWGKIDFLLKNRFVLLKVTEFPKNLRA